LAIFLGVLALLIHFILLSTDRFNWLQDPAAGSATAMQVMPESLPENLVAGRSD